MPVPPEEKRQQWRARLAALGFILCRDERHLPASLRRRILEWSGESPENLNELLEMDRLDQQLIRVLGRSNDARAPASAPRGIITWRTAFATGAVATMVFLVVFVATLFSGNDPVRLLSLDDGSTIHVGPRASYRVQFSDKLRLVYLFDGEAIFDVAKDPRRPFIVRTPLNDVTAVGTRFSVAIDSVVTTIVSEGRVRVVVPAGARQTIGTLVSAGEETRVIPGARQPTPVAAVDAERKLSWSTGWLTFNGETLGDAAKAFNRFNVTQIEIAQSELSSVPLSFQRFAIDNSEEFAQTMARELNVPFTRDSTRDVIYIGHRGDK